MGVGNGYTTDQVVSLLDSSFQGDDSSDDDLDMDIEGLENTFFLEQSMQTQGTCYFQYYKNEYNIHKYLG